MPSETIQAVVLGLVQGLTEFLPISSSAHLVVVPWLLEWRPFGLTFDVLLHLGTLAAVLAYFREEWLQVGREVIAGRWRREGDRLPLASVLVVATLPVVAAGLLAGQVIETHLRGPGVAAFNLAMFGLILLAADRTASRNRRLDTIGWREALLVGGAQVLALVPGVSRSGITITAALALGFSRPESARLSFLMAGPAIGLAGAKSLVDLVRAGGSESFAAGQGLIGIMTAAVAGFLCIKYLLRFLRSGSFLPFVLYRCGLAALILFLLASGRLN